MASTGSISMSSRRLPWKRLAGSAAACSRFARRYRRSAAARKAVCAAIPPTALANASDTRPSRAAVSDTTVPDSEVAAPRSTAPVTASPNPVRSARRSTTTVMRAPHRSIVKAAAANRARMALKGRFASRVMLQELHVADAFMRLVNPVA